MSRTRLRVNPHSTVAWISQGSKREWQYYKKIIVLPISFFLICQRTQSSRRAHSHEISPINLIEERTLLADHISTLELEAADELYTPSNMNEEVLPEVTSDIGPGELFLWFIRTTFIRKWKWKQSLCTDDLRFVSN